MGASRWCLIGSSLVLLAVGSTLRADPPTAIFKDGHWVSVAPPPPPPPATDPVLDHMQQLLDSKNDSAALDLGISWVKTHTDKAPMRDRCLFLIALAKFNIHLGDNRVSSYYYCDELMDEYPESKYFYDALNLQYQIAEGYLEGYKDGLFGTPFTLPFVGEDGKGEEMLYRIQQRSPGSPLAEKAMLRTCDYYYSKGQYELAHDAYGYYIKSYPRSEKLAQIRLRQAYSSLLQYHGVRFDLTCLIDARAEFSDLIAAYPGLAKEQNLKAIIARIDTTLARKLLVTADFYRRTHALTGAVYMYRYLIETYPGSPDAATANADLAQMPKAVLGEPPPRPGANFSMPPTPGGT
jgi:outer membrane assembly lipoprotein YfiO